MTRPEELSSSCTIDYNSSMEDDFFGDSTLDGALGPGENTKLRRLPDRAKYDRSSIFSILDRGIVCHVGFSSNGQTFVIPTAYARDESALVLHGAPASHAMNSIVNGQLVCVTVTIVEGLVLSRASFHHSLNYSSVVLFGPAHEVTDLEEKERSLTLFVDQVIPGRSADARPPSPKELRATRVVRVDITEASAKIRSGGPNEDEGDLDRHIWAGHIPIRMQLGDPVLDNRGNVDHELPDYIENFAF